MRKLSAIALASCLVLGACQGKEAETGQMAMDEVMQESSQMVDAVKADLQAQLAQIDARIQELKVKADSATGDTKAMMTEQVQALETKAAGLQERVNTLAVSAETDWEVVKAEITQAVESLHQEVEELATGHSE